MPTLPYGSPEEVGFDPQRLEKAFGLLEAWTSGDNPPLPGGTMIVGRKGKTVEPRYFGKQGSEPDAGPLRRDGLFLMASITKPIVYMGALLLVERGQLSLSDRVTRLLPDFAAHHKEETRVVHLFTHTSGLPDMLENNTELRKSHAPLSRFVECAIRDTVPLFPPGTGYSYQSIGTLIVSHLIEKISGVSTAEFLRREIFEPLGMKSSALGSRGFDRNRLVRVKLTSDLSPEWGWNSRYWQELGAPWGAMFSTPDDMAIIADLLLNGGSHRGTRLLAPRTVQLMTTNRLDDLAKLPAEVRQANRWGLGWKMNYPADGDRLCDLLTSEAFGHTGSTGNLMWMDPASGAFCIILTTSPRALAPWRLVSISNAVAAALR